MNIKALAPAAALLSVALAASCPTWPSLAQPAKVGDTQDDLFPNEPPDDFFAGNYLIVGQKPADGAAYKGRTRIEVKDHHKIRLTRTINGKTMGADGKFVVCGEAKKKCLQFNWTDNQGAAEMFCQYGVDFDNNVRLSCVWYYGKGDRDVWPGFESYYPMDGL